MEIEMSSNIQQQFLGMLMVNNDLWNATTKQMTVHDFYDSRSAIIFSVILSLLTLKIPFDVITVAEYLEKNDSLEHIGGLTYLGMLVSNLPQDRSVAAMRDIAKLARRPAEDYYSVGKSVE